LEVSARELGELKAKLDDLVNFFPAILKLLEDTIRDHLDPFLSRITPRMGQNGDSGTDALRLTTLAKKVSHTRKN
jgi:hypothetical protein